MAYRRGKGKGVDRRMVAMGAMPADADWLGLRREWIFAANAIAASVRPDLLDDMPAGNEIDRMMLHAQAGLKGRINSVWAEKARISAKTAVIERHKRGRANLFGRLKHIDTVGCTPCDDGIHRFVNLPEDWSARISASDVAALKTLAESLDFAGAMAMLRKVRDGVSNLPPVQAELLAALVEMVEARFRHPQWGRDDETVVQLHLDYRCLPKGEAGSNREAWAGLQRRLTGVVRTVSADGLVEVVPVLVAAPVAYGPPKLVRAVVQPAPLKHLVGDRDPSEFEVDALCLEIGPRTIAVKGVLSQRPKVKPLSEVTHLVGRDFGYRNTVALAVVRKDRPVNVDRIAAAAD